MALSCISMFFLITLTNVSADCWSGLPTVAEEFRASSVVFVGTVVSERQEQPDDGFYDGMTYTLRVDEPLKGSGRKAVELFSENSTARYPMKVGERYLIFAYLESGRRHAVYTCGNTELFNPKSLQLAAVRRLAKRSK